MASCLSEPLYYFGTCGVAFSAAVFSAALQEEGLCQLVSYYAAYILPYLHHLRLSCRSYGQSLVHGAGVGEEDRVSGSRHGAYAYSVLDHCPCRLAVPSGQHEDGTCTHRPANIYFLVFGCEVDLQVGNGRLNYINGYIAKDHDTVDVGMGEYVQIRSTAPWLASYRLLCKSTPCIPEVALRMASASECDRTYTHVLPRPRTTS